MLDIKLLLQTLRAELTLHTQHVRILQAQHAALLACDRDEFCRLHAHHETLLARLETQKRERELLLRGDDGTPLSLSAVLESAGERARRSLETVRDALRETLTRAQEWTQRNTALMENETTYFAFLLDVFVDAARQPVDTYSSAPEKQLTAGRLGLDRRA